MAALRVITDEKTGRLCWDPTGLDDVEAYVIGSATIGYGALLNLPREVKERAAKRVAERREFLVRLAARFGFCMEFVQDATADEGLYEQFRCRMFILQRRFALDIAEQPDISTIVGTPDFSHSPLPS